MVVADGDQRRVGAEPQLSAALDDDDALLLVPGLNVFFAGRNKLSLNWEVFRPMGSTFKTYHALRAQAQLYL